MSQYYEVNFDGLVGPTHNYGGLSVGNVASMTFAGLVSNPQAAALQGLHKMRFLLSKGLMQAVLPPQLRPELQILRDLGYQGSNESVLRQAAAQNPELLTNVMSASSMWVANAATVSPSLDSRDQRLHLTPANLSSTFHRSLEERYTSRVLKSIFSDESMFAVHPAVMSSSTFGDEGAANHGRLAKTHAEQGTELFVYGRRAFEKCLTEFPRRQVLEASQSVASNHQLDDSNVVFLKQSSKAIDAGAFHNDVVSVTNEHVFFLHEETFEQQEKAKDMIAEKCDFDLLFIEVPANKVSLKDAISSYLFNSQLVTLPSGKMLLLAPQDVELNSSTHAYVNELLDQDNPISEVMYMDLRQSMNNGGGPACLRLRVLMNQQEIDALTGSVILNEAKIQELETIVKKHYRTQLSPTDLADQALINESATACEAIAHCLELPNIYEF